MKVKNTIFGLCASVLAIGGSFTCFAVVNSTALPGGTTTPIRDASCMSLSDTAVNPVASLTHTVLQNYINIKKLREVQE